MIQAINKITGNLNAATINVYPELEKIEITPEVEDKTYIPTEYGFEEVTVKGVKAYIDEDIKPEYIKDGVDILGVIGNVVELQGEEKTISPSTTQQIIVPSDGKNGITRLTVEAVDSSIDENIKPENIKEGTNILGVDGQYRGIDTSDATATEEDILIGKTAYVNGEKLTGTMEVTSGGGLSSDYQQVEYIESTGTQYIDTGVCPVAGSHTALVNYTLTDAVKGREQWAFGQWYISNGWRCGGYTNSYGTNTQNTSCGFNYTTGGVGTKVLGMSVKCPITSEYPMYLFAQQSGGNAEYLDVSRFKIYECKIWENQNMIRDFIPCYRKIDNIAGMFDLVNNVFYTNNGTGEFILGPKV